MNCIVSEEDWNTKEDKGKSMMHVYIVCCQNQACMSSYAWQGASVSTSVSQSVSIKFC